MGLERQACKERPARDTSADLQRAATSRGVSVRMLTFQYVRPRS